MMMNVRPLLLAVFLITACKGVDKNVAKETEMTEKPIGTEGVKTLEPAASTIKGEEVSYQAGGVTLKGYLAYDSAKEGPRPGVLVVHEWWGHNEYTRRRATMLAELGYTALAVDMYGDGKQAAHPADAKKFMMELIDHPELSATRFEAAKQLLEAHASTDASKISAIGYCLGGGVVLHMARSGMDLDGVASFHGGLATQTPAKKGQVKAKLLVAHGADDPMVTAEQLEAFQKEMKDAEVQLQFIAYPGAQHAFTNPAADELGKKFSLPLAYNKDADEKSWAELIKFLHDLYPPGPPSSR